MIAYSRDEIISASEVARGFSSVLNELVSGTKKRYAILKNNKLEAVILSIEEYEQMKEAFDKLSEKSEIDKKASQRL